MSSQRNQSWQSDNLDTAIEKLAKRAVTGRLIRDMRKSAQGDLVGQVTEFLKTNPGVAAGLAGAGAGGVLGAGTSLMAPKGEKKPIRSALKGMMAGGALGGGGYAAAKYIPQALSSTAGGDKSRKINALVQDYAGHGPAEIASDYGDRLWNMHKRHPILATLLGADVLTQGIGTIANTIKPQVGLRPELFAAGIDKADISDELRGALQRFKDLPRSKQLQALRLLMAGKTVPVNVGEFAGKLNPDTAAKVYRAGAGPVQRGGLASLLRIFKPNVKGRQALWGTGFDPSVGGGLAGFLDKRVTGPGLKAFETARNPFGTGWGGRLGPRAALYLGIPAAASLLSAYNKQNDSRRQIEQLLSPGA